MGRAWERGERRMVPDERSGGRRAAVQGDLAAAAAAATSTMDEDADAATTTTTGEEADHRRRGWDYYDRLRERHVSPAAPPSDVYRVPATFDDASGAGGGGIGRSGGAAAAASGDDDHIFHTRGAIHPAGLPGADDIFGPHGRQRASDTIDREPVHYDLRHLTNLNPLYWSDSAVAGVLALRHFNEGVSDVVPQIAQVRERCGGGNGRTRFTMDFVDTAFSPIHMSTAFLNDVAKRKKRGTGQAAAEGERRTMMAAEQQQQKAGRKRRRTETGAADPLLPVPTLLIGARRSVVSAPLATLAGVHSLPQISYASTSTALDNTDAYPLFGRVIPSNAGDADAAIDFFRSVHQLSHLGVLHVRDTYGVAYAQALSNAASGRGGGGHSGNSNSKRKGSGGNSNSKREDGKVRPIKLRVASFPAASSTPEARRTAIAEAVRQLRRSGLRYFFGIFFPDDFDTVMSEARAQGIAGEGYFWMFGDAFKINGKTFNATTENGRQLLAASRGSAVLATAEPALLPGTRGYDAFLKHWDALREEGSEGRRYFDAIMPEEHRLAAIENFGRVPPSKALFSYDAVIAAAFAVCDAANRATAAAAASNGGAVLDDDDGPVSVLGEEVYASFLNTTFDGTYGVVSIDKKGSRRPLTVPYSVSNLLPDPGSGSGVDGTVRMRLVDTHVSGSGSGGGAEAAVGTEQPEGSSSSSSWRSLRTFYYSDGTADAPPTLPPLQHDYNYMGVGARSAGYVMCGIIILTSLAFSAFTYRHREGRVIKSAQPVFLYILAAGTLIMGSAIIPLAVEEPVSERGLDVACMCTPWLATLGFSLIFATLHAKEVRVAKVMRKNMRRVKVSAMQVLKPAAALVGTNVLLMAIWTGVAPFEYTRTPIAGSSDEFGRSTQSYGSCELPKDPSDPNKTWWVGIFFVAVIAVVNFAKLTVALYQVYKTRHIETEFSEAKFLGLSMVSIVQAWLIGIPLVLAGRGSPRGLFIIVSALIFIMCMSILILIFVPKMWFRKAWKAKQMHRERERVRKSATPSWMIDRGDANALAIQLTAAAANAGSRRNVVVGRGDSTRGWGEPADFSGVSSGDVRTSTNIRDSTASGGSAASSLRNLFSRVKSLRLGGEGNGVLSSGKTDATGDTAPVPAAVNIEGFTPYACANPLDDAIPEAPDDFEDNDAGASESASASEKFDTEVETLSPYTPEYLLEKRIGATETHPEDDDQCSDDDAAGTAGAPLQPSLRCLRRESRVLTETPFADEPDLRRASLISIDSLPARREKAGGLTTSLSSSVDTCDMEVGELRTSLKKMKSIKSIRAKSMAVDNSPSSRGGLAMKTS